MLVIPKDHRSVCSVVHSCCAARVQTENPGLSPSERHFVPDIEMYSILIVAKKVVAAHQCEPAAALARVVHIDAPERMGEFMGELIEWRERTAAGDKNMNSFIHGEIAHLQADIEGIVVPV